MIRIVKDGLTFECDTEAELRLALGVLADMQTEAVSTFEVQMHPMDVGYVPVDCAPPIDDDPDDDPIPRTLELVQDSNEVVRAIESPDSVAESTTVQHISVRRTKLEVLEAVMLFPEGVATGSIAQLLGITEKAACNRVQALKRLHLVERVNGHWHWRATPLARRAKLVAC